MSSSGYKERLPVPFRMTILAPVQRYAAFRRPFDAGRRRRGSAGAREAADRAVHAAEQHVDLQRHPRQRPDPQKKKKNGTEHRRIMDNWHGKALNTFLNY